MNSIKKVQFNTWIILSLGVLFIYVALGLAPFDADSYDSRGQPVHEKAFGSTADLPYRP